MVGTWVTLFAGPIGRGCYNHGHFQTFQDVRSDGNSVMRSKQFWWLSFLVHIAHRTNIDDE